MDLEKARHFGRRVSAAIAIGLFAAAAAATAQNTYELVHAFRKSGGPTMLIRGADGTLYGTTSWGGTHASGSVFRLDSSGAIVTLHSFGPYVIPPCEPRWDPDPNPSPFITIMQAADGRLYGTTNNGGDADWGTVFVLDTTGHFELLHSLAFSDGTRPYAPLIQGADGNLYGTTTWGGQVGHGTAFRVALSGEFNVLHAFDDPFDGRGVYGALIQASDGNFYGTTAYGGGNLGTIFRMDPTGTVTVLHHFSGPDGAHPRAALIQAANGKLMGTTAGSLGFAPTAFEITTNGEFASLHAFDPETQPSSLIEAEDGNFYGETAGGGDSGMGAIFGLTPSGIVTTVHDFAGNDGTAPMGGLAKDSGDRLYGVTNAGGRGGTGTIFQIDVAAELVSLQSFDNEGEPAGLSTYLLKAADGAFYGVSDYGGQYGAGTIFKLTSHGELTTIHSFAGSEGSRPYSALIQAQDGKLYGTARSGGLLGFGSVFSVTGSGDFAAIHHFNSTDGANPEAPLLQVQDGTFYGTTAGGGSGAGTAFAMDAAGSILRSGAFDGSNGAYPRASLVLGWPGTLYGTAEMGGVNNLGTVFFASQWDSGVYALHSFDDQLKGNPKDAVTAVSNGMLYGIVRGGDNGGGSIFKIDPSIDPEFNFAWVHDFWGMPNDGMFPSGPLIQASNGNLYGTTRKMALFEGDQFYWGEGTVFGLDLQGSYGVVRGFKSGFGRYPIGGLIEGFDGSLYGVTESGGPFGNQSVVFRLSTARVAVNEIWPSSAPADGGIQIDILGGGFDAGVSVSVGGLPAADVEVIDSTFLEASTPDLFPGALYDVSAIVSDPGLGSGATATHPNAFFADFLDVPQTDPFHDYVEKIVRSGVTAGCGAGDYCPADAVTRAQMAVFLLKSKHGSAYIPPSCAGVFGDVSCPSMFVDWIEQLAAEGITVGCGGGNYCPSNAVTRAQMAAFLLKTKHGSAYVPPPCAGVFADVSCPSLFADWIEQLAAEQITSGCGGGNYCPGNPNTREQMAVFLVKTFKM